MTEPIASFDPVHASLPTRAVPVDEVVDLLHKSHALDRIREYRLAMLAGARFPPISVIQLGRWFVITDGHKRFAACKELGLTALDVEAWTLQDVVADQLAQLDRHARLWWRTISGLYRGPASRREAWMLAKSTLLHWRRVAASLSILVARSFLAQSTARKPD